MEHDLKKKITEFICKVQRFLLVDCSDAFPGFFRQIRTQRLMCLNPVPGATVRIPKPVHDAKQIIQDKTVADHKV